MRRRSVGPISVLAACCGLAAFAPPPEAAHAQMPPAPLQPPAPARTAARAIVGPKILPQEQALPGTPAAPGELSAKSSTPTASRWPASPSGIWTWEETNDKPAAADGTFKLQAAENNDTKVEIRFTKDGWCPRYITYQPTGLSDLLVVMDRDTYIEGRVIAPDGKPLAKARVRGDHGPKQLDGVLNTSVWTETARRRRRPLPAVRPGRRLCPFGSRPPGRRGED